MGILNNLLQGAKVKVTRWHPGVLQAIVEEVKSKSMVSKTNLSVPANIDVTSVKDMLAKEATHTLESKRNLQIAATKEKSLDIIKKEMGIPIETTKVTDVPTETNLPTVIEGSGPRRRVRQKMRSTPVTGGSLFDDNPKPVAHAHPQVGAESSEDRAAAFRVSSNIAGQKAELVVNGEVFNIRVMPETVHRIRSGYSGEILDDASVKFSHRDVPIEHRLQGFIRTGGLSTISEDLTETASNHPSEPSEDNDSGW
jgi:hypothetical protein